MAFNVSLPKVQLYIDQAWVDPIQKADLRAEVEALRMHLTKQTARVEPIISGTGRNAKKITKTIYWQDFCNLTTEACSDDCVQTSAASDDTEMDVTISTCRQIEFAYTEKQFYTTPHDPNQTIAMALAARMKTMDEYLNAQFLAFLEANKGVHQYEIQGGTADGNDWVLPAENWDEDLIPQLQLAARFSKFNRPYLLDGTNLWAKVYKAGYYSANADGKGENLLFNTFPYVFDPLTINTVAPNKTYMVNSSAVALVHGNYYGDAREEAAPGHFRYRIQSRNLPGIFYDVIEKVTCTSNDILQSWQLKANFSFFLNPKGCDTDITGILAFEKGAGA